METQTNVKRGGQFFLSNDELSEIINQLLGFNQRTLIVRGVNNSDYMDGVAINVLTYDERFPELIPGIMLPVLTTNAIQELEMIDGTFSLKRKYNGFIGIETTELPSEAEAVK